MAPVSGVAGAWIGLSAVRTSAERVGAFDLADDGLAILHHLQDPGLTGELARQDIGGLGVALGHA